MKINCPNCKIEFECAIRKFNFNTKNGYQIFCSHKCAVDSRNRHVITNCAQCNKEIKRANNQVKSSKSGRLFCTKSCSTAYNNQFRVGIKNSNFKNGIASYRKLKLDNSDKKCEKCGNDNICVLQVHHKDQNRKIMI